MMALVFLPHPFVLGGMDRHVNVVHILSEMPLLGYFGYMPFGILVGDVHLGRQGVRI
ncbi:hypothetical protein [Methylobacillus sp. MM3]|uniref:hypothetical protein n=1 Tax=Methylobacillus sp. MM3 TaxID=1848039 RepID=UPI00196A0292|nr:hypothetical protein [Methylobacillus sp. MM3]